MASSSANSSEAIRPRCSSGAGPCRSDSSRRGGTARLPSSASSSVPESSTPPRSSPSSSVCMPARKIFTARRSGHSFQRIRNLPPWALWSCKPTGWARTGAGRRSMTSAPRISPMPASRTASHGSGPRRGAAPRWISPASASWEGQRGGKTPCGPSSPTPISMTSRWPTAAAMTTAWTKCGGTNFGWAGQSDRTTPNNRT